MVVAQTYPAEVVARFWTYVERGGADECWPWRGYVTPSGYGRFRLLRIFETERAHRVAYMIERGPIPDGLVIDHLCRNRACVNPAHMDVVTNGENILRGVSPSAKNAAKVFCARGHPLLGVNVYVLARGGRKCLTCHRLTDKAYNDRHRERRTAKRNAMRAMGRWR